MLAALVAAGTAFYEALPNHVPRKNKIRAQLEDEITLIEVTSQKAKLQEIAASDSSGETKFDMVHADCSKRCKDKQLEASLDRVDLRFLSGGAEWVVGLAFFLLALSNGGAFLSRREQREWLESLTQAGFVLRIFVPLVISIAISILKIELENRARAYEKELRQRIILDRSKQ